jgi:hypothetical protein
LYFSEACRIFKITVMKYKFAFVLAISFLMFNIASAQYIGWDEIDESKLKPWTDHHSTYEYVYHFGFSEGESDLLILSQNNKLYAQIKEGSFSDDGMSFISNYRNLTNVRVDGNKFLSDQYTGEFVFYNDGERDVPALKIDNPWSGMPVDGKYEIGLSSYMVADYFAGKYPQASRRELSVPELKDFTAKELKIMRNEIFARYGYTFIPGGAMDTYFRQQDWYRAEHKNVDAFLTDLEKQNIKLIQKVEAEK